MNATFEEMLAKCNNSQKKGNLQSWIKSNCELMEKQIEINDLKQSYSRSPNNQTLLFIKKYEVEIEMISERIKEFVWWIDNCDRMNAEAAEERNKHPEKYIIKKPVCKCK